MKKQILKILILGLLAGVINVPATNSYFTSQVSVSGTITTGDWTPPEVTWVTPEDGDIRGGVIELQAVCDGTGSESQYVNFWWYKASEGQTVTGDGSARENSQYHYVRRSDPDADVEGDTFSWELDTKDESLIRSDLDWDGEWRLRAACKDAYGNYAHSEIDVVVDNTAPVGEITNPNDGDYVRGEIEVKGTVTDDNPDHYWLVAEEKESGDRVSDFPGVVDESDSLEDEVLHNWDTTDVDDGEYIIKLEARDAAGNKDPDQAPVSEDPEVDGDSVDWITVTVDNTAPEVPENLGFNATVEDYGSRPVEIECGGRVYQNQISHHWTEIDDAVEYERQWIRPGGDPEDEDAWEGSESWTTPYTNYRTFGGDPGTEGEWYVRVRARDEAGNWSDYSDPCAVHYYNRPVYEVEDGCPEGEVPVPVESLEIDSTSKDGETISLNGGEHYIFEAKGTYEFGSSGKVADSGYASNNNWQSLRTDIGIWEDALYRGVTSLLGDLGEGVGIIPWGDDNEDHEYSVAYRLNNNIEARFLISDWYGEWYDSVWNNQGAMSDNSGSLDLNIYKCGPVLESGDLLINEVYYQEPVCDERNDSGWIELYNVSDKEIPLKGWRLENSAGNEKEIKSNNVKLSPGEFAILSHAASTWNTCWEDVPEDVKTVHWIGSKSWLDTDSDSLTLYYGDEEADFVAWGEKEGDWDLIADKGESIARKGDCEGADDLECWEVSDDPTPGEDN